MDIEDMMPSEITLKEKTNTVMLLIAGISKTNKPKLIETETPTVIVRAKGWSGEDSVQFSRSLMSDSLRPHELQHARSPCPSPTPGVHPNPCPMSQ